MKGFVPRQWLYLTGLAASISIIGLFRQHDPLGSGLAWGSVTAGAVGLLLLRAPSPLLLVANESPAQRIERFNQRRHTP